MNCLNSHDFPRAAAPVIRQYDSASTAARAHPTSIRSPDDRPSPESD
jgi:hypothetical protein